MSRIRRNAVELGSKAARLDNACTGIFSGACVPQSAERLTFSPVPSGEKSGAGEIGPGSNTGQKGQGGAIVDYLTLVVPQSAVEDFRCSNISLLLYRIFGFRGEVVAGELRQKNWMFYRQSAVLVDREGEMVGRIGCAGNNDTICISLSGAGCKWVKDWARVRRECEALRARISRVDVAHDDYEGKRLDVHKLRERAIAGDFCEGGHPPRHRFLSDEGHGTGCTLYVGGKGHKELCVYEKGKQLGLPSSPWVRAEVRLYGKHMHLPFDILTNPVAYLRGAYGVLRDLIEGACTRLRTIRKQVEVSTEAAVTWLRRQAGPLLFCLREAFGASFADVLEARVVRDGHPGRFRGVAKGEPLFRMMREELCLSAA
jgi:Putative phage replication protein RstA